MEEFLDEVEEHDTLDRNEDYEEEVIKPVMSEPEDLSDSEDEWPLTSSLPMESRYDFEFIKKLVK